MNTMGDEGSIPGESNPLFSTNAYSSIQFSFQFTSYNRVIQ